MRLTDRLPLAREKELVVRELFDEVLVYDKERDKAYCLNRSVALVWKFYDGRTTVEQMARLLQKEVGTPADAEVVALAVKQLAKSRLLLQTPAGLGIAAISRRRLILKYAPAALALPVIMAMTAPAVMAQASCA